MSTESDVGLAIVASDVLFLRWNLVEHVAKNLPQTVCLFLPDKQVLAASTKTASSHNQEVRESNL